MKRCIASRPTAYAQIHPLSRQSFFLLCTLTTLDAKKRIIDFEIAQDVASYTRGALQDQNKVSFQIARRTSSRTSSRELQISRCMENPQFHPPSIPLLLTERRIATEILRFDMACMHCRSHLTISHLSSTLQGNSKSVCRLPSQENLSPNSTCSRGRLIERSHNGNRQPLHIGQSVATTAETESFLAVDCLSPAFFIMIARFDE